MLLRMYNLWMQRTQRWVRELDTVRFRRWVPVSSNHLDIRSVWKSLVASFVCVAEPQTCIFNAFVSSTINKLVFNLEIGFETLQKRTETREKSFCKASFHVGMELKRYRNKAEMKECKKTTSICCVSLADIGWSSCILSSLPCSCTSSGSSLS